MRRPTLVLSSSLAAIGLSASIALAQQSSRSSQADAPPSSPADAVDPVMATRPTRYLLRNGQDYLAYREYARALSFFRAVEARQSELNPAEIQTLKKSITLAQQGLREAVNSNKVMVKGRGRATVQPGAFALAKPAPAPAPTDPVQLASAELPAPPPSRPAGNVPALPAPMPSVVALPTPAPAPAPVAGDLPPSMPELPPTPTSTAPATTPAPPPIGLELPELPSEPPAAAPTADRLALPAQATSPIELPPVSTPPPSTSEPSLPAIPEATAAAPSTVEPPSAEVSLPPLPMPTDPTPPTIPPTAEPAAPVEVPPRLALAPQRSDSPAPRASAPEPPPVAEAPPAPEVAPAPEAASTPMPTADRSGEMPDSILSPSLRREVEQIAQRPSTDDRTPGAAPIDPADPTGPMPPSQGSTRLELPRAPSPTEARPLRRIPVPEEFVPLGRREWNPNRKYWAAAATCHMVLYFQDPVLERYGQGVEQSLGPVGRFFSYPLDDPRQSNQRNQILQPFYSFGKFCFQVGTLPYKLIVDPPWEAEYDLGYYRPGDRIPADTIMITPYGVGAPGKGRNY